MLTNDKLVDKNKETSFIKKHSLLDKNGEPTLGRTGVITTPHGDIETPAFIPVGTRATVKTLTVEQLSDTGAQAMLANAYHLYLRPGHEIIDAAGGLNSFMNWDKPTYTDSGGFQVMSLGAGFQKVLSAEFASKTLQEKKRNKQQLAKVDDDGVTFKSHIDGSYHRFTPEFSMQIQHGLGADIIFAFDELTTLVDSYDYQKLSLVRTQNWAERCLIEHNRLTDIREDKAKQSLWAVVQGAQYEDLRKKASIDLEELSKRYEDNGMRGFGGYGIGGALAKENLGEIVKWVCESLPENKPRHLLGISEPDDIFNAVECGIESFDCVSPARLARHGNIYTKYGKINLKNAKYKADFSLLDETTASYSSLNYTKAYLRHLFVCQESLGMTLATIHNIFFVLQLMQNIRTHIANNSYWDFKTEFLTNYYSKTDK